MKRAQNLLPIFAKKITMIGWWPIKGQPRSSKHIPFGKSELRPKALSLALGLLKHCTRVNNGRIGRGEPLSRANMINSTSIMHNSYCENMFSIMQNATRCPLSFFLFRVEGLKRFVSRRKFAFTCLHALVEEVNWYSSREREVEICKMFQGPSGNSSRRLWNRYDLCVCVCFFTFENVIPCSLKVHVRTWLNCQAKFLCKKLV